MNRRTSLILAIVIAALAGTGYFLSRHLERYSREINTGPTLDAMVNAWLAAQQFLARHHIESHRAMDLHSILNRLKPDDTLILASDNAIYDTDTQSALKKWMRGGGHLIMNATYEWSDKEQSSGDPFLDGFGVHMTSTQTDDSENGTDQTENKTNPDKTPPNDKKQVAKKVQAPPICPIYYADDVFLVHYKDAAEPLQINFGYYDTLDDTSGNASGNAHSWPNGILQYKVGKGMLSVLVDTEIWNNRRIGHYDHAFLLWYLVGDSARVWLVSSTETDKLPSLIWRNAPYLVIGLAALLLAWGWRRATRFGPLLPEPSPNRRQLLEHIEANGQFCWQHGQLEPLLKSVRDQIWLRLSQQHGIQNHDPAMLDTTLAKLAEISQQPVDQVRNAMTCAAPNRELQWVELISQLQTIRNAL